MDDHTRLSVNKSTASIPFRIDPEIDITAIRIGKARIARKKDNKLSDIKQAILSQRESVPKVPTVLTDAILPDEVTSSTTCATTQQRPPYMEYYPNDLLDDLAFRVLKELARLQAKGNQQPLEKRYKYKRFIAGIREVQRALCRGDLKGIIVATNVEHDVDALNEIMVNVKAEAMKRDVPFVVALNKRRIGKALNKSMKQSVIGITNLEGVLPDWRSILGEVDNLISQARNPSSTIE